MRWNEISEVVFGLALNNKINSDAVDPGVLHPPYDLGMRILQTRGVDDAAKASLVDQIGISALSIARDAAANVNGASDPFIYVKMCEQSAVRKMVSMRLRPMVDALEMGQDIDVANALSELSKLDTGYRDFTPASEVTPEQQIYIPSHYDPLDRFVGGYPKAGLTIVAGQTGIGKSTFLMRLARESAVAGRTCAILTLEMTNGQIMYRMREIDPTLTTEQKQNILLSDDVYDVNSACAVSARLAAQYPDLHFIGIDYADILVGAKEQSEQTMGQIYNSLAVLAKKINIPVLLVAQYRRTNGQVPTIEDIRYSGRAEQAASMILLLYNQDMTFARSVMDTASNPLPHAPGCAWIVVGKTRYFGRQPSSIGAIKVQWNGQTGWGPAAGRDPWFDLSGRL